MKSSDSPLPAPRGALPDAETSDRIYLFKNLPALRATYQVKLLAMKAAATGKKLILNVPPSCRFDRSLRDLIGNSPQIILREDL